MRHVHTLRAAVLLSSFGVLCAAVSACATGVGEEDVLIPADEEATDDAGPKIPARPTEGTVNADSGAKRDGATPPADAGKDSGIEGQRPALDASDDAASDADGTADAARDAARDSSTQVADAALDTGPQIPDAGPLTPDTGTPSSPCLMFSEYLEGDSNDKALEIWNCGSQSFDLARTGLCLISNQDTRCSTTDMLTGVLAAGAVKTICTANFSNASKCDVSSPAVNFNGDDRLVLFRDEDVSGTFSRTIDSVWDAFGESSSRPSSTPWAEHDYRRNTCASYDGVGTFTVSSRYTTHSSADYSNLKVAPNLSCP